MSLSSFFDFGTGSAASTSATRRSILANSAFVTGAGGRGAGRRRARRRRGAPVFAALSSTRGKRPDSCATVAPGTRPPQPVSVRALAGWPSAIRIFVAASGTNGPRTMPRQCSASRQRVEHRRRCGPCGAGSLASAHGSVDSTKRFSTPMNSQISASARWTGELVHGALDSRRRLSHASSARPGRLL